MIDEVVEECIIEEDWRKWKEKVLATAGKGIGRKNVMERSENGG